jgi:hypothetical protein
MNEVSRLEIREALVREALNCAAIHLGRKYRRFEDRIKRHLNRMTNDELRDTATFDAAEWQRWIELYTHKRYPLWQHHN